jgi:hypothetical protein
MCPSLFFFDDILIYQIIPQFNTDTELGIDGFLFLKCSEICGRILWLNAGGRKILKGVGNIRSPADCRHVATEWTSVGHFENQSTTWKAAAKMWLLFRGFFPRCDQQFFSAHLLTVNLSQGSTAYMPTASGCTPASCGNILQSACGHC